VFDRWEHTIPKATEEKDAVKVRCPITKGFLRALAVSFPPGCEGLARCRINLGERPVVPRSPGNWIAADSEIIHIQYLNEPIQDDIPVLNWHVWNVDTLYPHTLWMSAEWLSEEKPYEMMMVESQQRLNQLLADLIGV